jgi:hypothetical protein
MFVLCVLYSKDERQKPGQSGEVERTKIKSRQGHGCLCCTVKDKRQSQDNQDKEVRMKYREQNKNKKNPTGAWMFLLCVLRTDKRQNA